MIKKRYYELIQKCRIQKDVERTSTKSRLGVSDMKLTKKDDDDERIVKYINSLKTIDTYAFSREPYTTIVKI